MIGKYSTCFFFFAVLVHLYMNWGSIVGLSFKENPKNRLCKGNLHIRPGFFLIKNEIVKICLGNYKFATQLLLKVQVDAEKF